jgi:hypothetical protein
MPDGGPPPATRAWHRVWRYDAARNFSRARVRLCRPKAFDDAWAEMASAWPSVPTSIAAAKRRRSSNGRSARPRALAISWPASRVRHRAARPLRFRRRSPRFAERHALAYLGEPPRPSVASFERKRSEREERGAELTERARSLEADFAGARADIANRRARGEAVGPQARLRAAAAGGRKPRRSPRAPRPRRPRRCTTAAPCAAARRCSSSATIVVVGDVNPGAELVATRRHLRLRSAARHGARRRPRRRARARLRARTRADATAHRHLHRRRRRHAPRARDPKSPSSKAIASRSLPHAKSGSEH